MKKWIWLLAAPFLLFGLWLWSVNSLFSDMSDTSYKYEENYLSPDGIHAVTVWRSEASWSFGPVSVKVVGTSGGKESAYKTIIGDDGAKGKVLVDWIEDDKAQVTLQGKEQRDEIITVTFFGGEVQITSTQDAPVSSSPTPISTVIPALTLPSDPEYAHESIGTEVDIGDGEHTFWVEVVDTGEPIADCNKLLINIYRNDAEGELFQTFESWWAAPYGLCCFSVEDMDFDGDMDFSVCNQNYRSFHFCSHYLWDEEQEQFVEDPYGLDGLTNVEFDAERQTVKAYMGDIYSQTFSYYHYQDGELICYRTLSYKVTANGAAVLYQVEDWRNGALTVVYEDHKELGNEPDPESRLYTEEFERWFDLDYCG